MEASTTVDLITNLVPMLLISYALVGPLLHMHWRNQRHKAGIYTAREIYRQEQKLYKQELKLKKLRSQNQRNK